MCVPQCNTPNGMLLVEGKAATRFKDLEEGLEGTGLDLRELGSKYECTDNWKSKVCIDGKLVTGQNPVSSQLWLL